MAIKNALVDSSFLYALYDHSADKHREVSATAQLFRGRLVVPYVVLTETAYLFRRAGGVPNVVRFLDALINGNFQYEVISPDDLTRAREIMAEYADSRLDFVDCCIMALAERLGITQVCTLDYRDFSMFRPKHATHLEILP